MGVSRGEGDESSLTRIRDIVGRSSDEDDTANSDDRMEELVEAMNRPIDPYWRSSVESILEIGESGTAGNGASGHGFRDRPGEPSGDNISDCEDCGGVVGDVRRRAGGEFGGVELFSSRKLVFSSKTGSPPKERDRW